MKIAFLFFMGMIYMFTQFIIFVSTTNFLKTFKHFWNSATTFGKGVMVVSIIIFFPGYLMCLLSDGINILSRWCRKNGIKKKIKNRLFPDL